MKRVVIGIGGGTGAGKTALAREIAGILNSWGVVIIQQDSYYLDRSQLSESERERINYDHSSAIDIKLLLEHISKLRAGDNIQMPLYDFTTHTRKLKTQLVRPMRVIIIEGILVLARKELRELMDIKIFVDAEPDMRFIRRLQRDIIERGRNAESVIQQYLDTVRPMHQKFVEKTKAFADIIVSGEIQNDNKIATIVTKIRTLLDDK